MKTCITIVIVMTLFSLWLIIHAININYVYNRDILYHWRLADKSSTIEAKYEHLSQFIMAFDTNKLNGTYNAIVFKTPDNYFNANYQALNTLVIRLWQIKDMDMNTFQYQTAIQQITDQEQGEADIMLKQLKGCWYLANHYFLLWKYIFAAEIILLVIAYVFCFAYISLEYDY